MTQADDRVREAEADIDRFFEDQLVIRGIYRPAMVDSLMERAELLVTGARGVTSRDRGALTGLYLNVVGGLNWAIREATRLSAGSRRDIPENLDSIATEVISLGIFYQYVQDAFMSYWKAYASAEFPSSREIRFIPTSTVPDLDARLRYHSCDEGIEPAEDVVKRATNPLHDASTPTAERFVKSLIANSSFQKEGGFQYPIEGAVIQDVATKYESVTASALAGVPALRLGSVTLADLVKGWSVVCAVSSVHLLVSVLMAKDPTDLSSSVNWPALVRTEDEWIKWFGSVGLGPEAIRVLTFDPRDRAGDVAITPLVQVDDGYLGIVPSLALNFNYPRNILVLLARKYSAVYSAYSASREDMLLGALKQSCSSLRAIRVKLPEWDGRQLPDIDVLMSDGESKTVVVGEVKWQLSASDTRETAARDDYLKKGSDQLIRIKSFLEQNPAYLRTRGLLSRDTGPGVVDYLLLCKGHMGSESVLRPGITIADYDVFVDKVRQGGLKAALGHVKSYDYLPVVGRDILLQETTCDLGHWRMTWRHFMWPSLPPDEETDALEDLYRKGMRFVRDNRTLS